MPFAGLPPVVKAPQTERGTVMDRSFVSLQAWAISREKQLQAGPGMLMISVACISRVLCSDISRATANLTKVDGDS